MALPRDYPQSYAECIEWLGSRDSKKVANNTYLHRLPEAVGIKYHNTFIATFHECGHIDVNVGGWFTVTTRERLRAIFPSWPHRPGWSFEADRYEWRMTYRNADNLIEHQPEILRMLRLTARGSWRDHEDGVFAGRGGCVLSGGRW